MYFDTIHEIPEFDAVHEAGYQSYWETDTDIQTDDEYGSFIFSKVDGDSASVVCIEEDEAIQLIQRFKLSRELPPLPVTVCDIPPADQPRIEATYENMEDEMDEHVYESIDDCKEEYQLFLCNDEGSPPNNVTPTHAKITHRTKPNTSSSSNNKTKRSHSLPYSSSQQYDHISHAKFSRKYSDCTEYSKLPKRHNRSNSLDKPSYMSHAPPLPPPNESHDYAMLFGITDNKKTSPSHQQQQVVLKHKGKEYILPLADNNGTSSNRVRKSSPKHMNHSPSATSHLNNNHYAMLPSSASNYQIRRSPCRTMTEVKYDTPSLKKKGKHQSSAATTSAAYSTISTNPNSKRVTLYGVL